MVLVWLRLFPPVQVFLPLRCTNPTGSQKGPIPDIWVLQVHRELRQQGPQPGPRQVWNHHHHRGCERGRHGRQRLHHHLRRQRRLGPASSAAEVPQPVRARANGPLCSGDAGPRGAAEGQSGARQQRLQLWVVLRVRRGDQHSQLSDDHLSVREVAGHS